MHDNNVINIDIDIENLPDDPATLKKMLSQVMSRYQYLEEQFRIAQHKQFGKSTEGHPGQGELFNEAEELVAEVETPEQEAISYTRNKPKRKSLPKDLPREVIVHDIPEAEKICDCCASELHCIGEDKAEKLQFIPAQVKVIEHVRPKYACLACEKDGISNTIKQALVPHSVIPKGYATPNLLSQIITSKYQYGLPLYRQEAMFKQHGIELSRKTMADWIIRCAELFKPLYDQLHQHLLQQPVIQADETTLKVVDADKATSYMWLYATGADSPAGKIPNTAIPNIVLYDYHNSRAGKCAVDFLKGYNGYLQVDGYQGYEQTQATLIGCWAHARRKFMEAKKGAGKKGSGKADWALNHIQKLYRIETQLKDKTVEVRYLTRQEKSLPLLNQLHVWLMKSVQQVLPKTKLDEAIQYSLNQWEKTMYFFEQIKERYEAQSENRTGIVSLGEDANRVGLDADHFFIDGEKVSKEIFILNSGMEHLIPDRTMVRCTRCGRAESPEFYKKICGKSPLVEECQGIFFQWEELCLHCQTLKNHMLSVLSEKIP